METVPGALKFIINSCGHAFCSGCVAQYVAAKLGENVARVKCTGESSTVSEEYRGVTMLQ